MPSADTSGVVGPPTIATISAFFGVTDNGNGTYTKGPEKLPPTPYPDDIWYRRSVPVTAAEIFGLGVQAYLVHPVVFGSNSGKGNSFTGRQAEPQRKRLDLTFEPQSGPDWQRCDGAQSDVLGIQ